MRFLLVMSVLCLENFLASSTMTSNIRMVQIVHPDLELYYLEMLSSTVALRENQFSEMSKEEKRQICLSSVQSPLFYVSDENRSNLSSTRFSRRTSVEEINRWYDTNIPDAVKYYSIATAVKAVVLRVNAQRCRSTPERKWFLTHGDLPGTYITLGKDHKDYYTIRGFLEPVPEITSINYSKNKFALDNYFMQKMKKINSSETAKPKKRNICELTDLQKIRLCSAVFVAYQQYIGGKVKTTNKIQAEGRRNLCFKNALIELETEENSIEVATMDLIPCILSEKSPIPIFYLADDDIYSESKAFVLHRIDDASKGFDEKHYLQEKTVDLDSSSIVTFRLALHVQKLAQLGT